MNERFVEAMRDREVVKDTRLLGDFCVIYCTGVHEGRDRTPLRSDAASLGVYGTKPPVVCDECAELLAYAEKRRAFCPLHPKPFCNYCETHCYKADMRARMTDVMRYAGPRSMWHGYAVEGIKHLIAGRRHKREPNPSRKEPT